MTYRVEILNPKAKNLLRHLADLNLITISKMEETSFSEILKKLRAKAKKNTPSLAIITREVESMRKNRHGKKKK